MSTNRARARRILESMTNRWGKPATARDAAQALADADLLAPELQVIRTREELASLDPQTILDTLVEAPYRARDAVDAIGAGEWEGEWLPAAVIATGDHTRAARQALKEEE